jgi:proteic killer suppression protein
LPIKNFRDAATENFFATGKSKGGWQQAGAVAMRKLDMLNAAGELKDLRSPPGNRLEALSGDRQGQWSIRINDQWRICFVWTDAGPAEVEIVDYH